MGIAHVGGYTPSNPVAVLGGPSLTKGQSMKMLGVVSVMLLLLPACSVTIPVSALNFGGTSTLTSQGGDASMAWFPILKKGP